MSKPVKYLHLICTEPRIKKIYHDFLVNNNLFGNFDTIQFANPILALSLPDSRLLVLKMIEDIINMHSNSEIVLFDHLDCGAYKSHFKKFADIEDELKKHKQINEEVIELLRLKFPNVKIDFKMIKIFQDNSCDWIV